MRLRLREEANAWQLHKARKEEQPKNLRPIIRYEEDMFKERVSKHVIIATRSFFDTLSATTQVYDYGYQSPLPLVETYN